MDRKDQLKYCKVCMHQKLDFDKGFLCSLTMDYPDFEEECPYFKENEDLVKKEKKRKIERVLSKTTNTIEGDEDVEIYYDYANNGTRIANYLIDLIVIYFTIIFITVLIGNMSGAFIKILVYNIFARYLYAFIIIFIYYFTFEYLLGKTVAKMITKTKVLTTNGEKPDAGTIISRTFARFIPFEAFSFFGSYGNGWHDKLSKTVVVQL